MGFIAKFQAHSFKDVSTLCQTIFDTIVSDKKSSKNVANAVMYKFENSGSFASANQNFQLVKQSEYWDKSLVSRLRNAARNNSQISGSFGLPYSIQYLLNELKSKKKY
jgi:hypothetical protein